MTCLFINLLQYSQTYKRRCIWDGKIYFDAATKGNPGRSACAVVIKEESERHVFTHDLGELDNHSAEWAAMIYALEHARELNVRNALLHTDSKLIEDSVNSGRVKMLNLNLIMIIWKFSNKVLI